MIEDTYIDVVDFVCRVDDTEHPLDSVQRDEILAEERVQRHVHKQACKAYVHETASRKTASVSRDVGRPETLPKQARSSPLLSPRCEV